MKQTLQQPHIHTSANSEIETCDICHHHHPHLPMEAPADETLYRLADLYKVFGDPTRIRILYALSGGELCVCDIARTSGYDTECHLPSVTCVKAVWRWSNSEEMGKPYITLWLTRMWQLFSHRDWIMYRNKHEL